MTKRMKLALHRELVSDAQAKSSLSLKNDDEDDSDEDESAIEHSIQADQHGLISLPSDNGHPLSPDSLRPSEDAATESKYGYHSKKRRKSRIPWDRKSNGDRNGLKRALLLAVLQRNLYRSENLDGGFQEICDELSAEGSLFAPYGGISKDAAQRKLLAILNDVQDNFHLDENSNLYAVATDGEDSLMDLGLEVLRQKRGLPRREKSEGSYPSHRLLHSSEEEKDDTDDELHFPTNIRIPPRRTFVVEELGRQNIKTINNLFGAISLSEEAKDRFVQRTGFQLNRSVQYFLGLFEEVMNSKHCNRAIERDLGLTFSEGSDLIEYLRAYYLKFEE